MVAVVGAVNVPATLVSDTPLPVLLALLRPLSCRSLVRSDRPAAAPPVAASDAAPAVAVIRVPAAPRERARTADGQGRAVAAHDVEVGEVQGATDRRELHPGDAHGVARRADDRRASGHRVQRPGRRRGVEDHARAGDDDARRDRVAGHDVVVERRDEDGARGARDLQPGAARGDGVVVDGQRGRPGRRRGDDDAILPGTRHDVLADAHAQVLRVRRARLDGVAGRAREVEAPDLDAGAIRRWRCWRSR